MENGKILDTAITASLFLNAEFKPEFARLNTIHGQCAWTPPNGIFQDQWVQVDFGQIMLVTGVATQGRCSFGQWIKSYSLSYTTDGQSWQSYKEGGKEKVGSYFIK